MRGRFVVAAACAALVLGVAACGGKATGATASDEASPAASGAAEASETGPGHAVLAFAGDVHFEGASQGTSDLGSAFDVLGDADLAVVNLETAVTTGGSRVDKQFAFRAPPAVMAALRDVGVDAVSVANNHGMDYGATGLTDTLRAGREAHLPVLGAGEDVDAAFTPLRAEPGGVPVSVIAATDVIDSTVETAWTATRSHAGLASAKDEDRLLADVAKEKKAGRVVVVFLHWGTEKVQCPTSRQQTLAKALTGAGADLVVGSHAHVLEPTAEVTAKGRTALVAYGMGNFHFYAKGGPGAQTGVLTVDVDRKGVTGSQWHPATIRSGRPHLLTSAQQAAASRSADELTALGAQCAAGKLPSTPPGPGQGGAADEGDGDGESAGPSASAGAGPSQGPSQGLSQTPSPTPSQTPTGAAPTSKAPAPTGSPGATS